MSDIERRTDRSRRSGSARSGCPGTKAELRTHIETASPEGLLPRNRSTAACRIDAVNMATVYGERTDGCGSVGCLAALAILEHPEEAATARRRIARDDNLPERAVSMLDVAGRILGLDPATRDAHFCGVGSRWFEDLRAMPKRPSSTPSTARWREPPALGAEGHRFESCRARQLLRPFLPTHRRRTPPRGAQPRLQECAPLYGADSWSGRAKT